MENADNTAEPAKVHGHGHRPVLGLLSALKDARDEGRWLEQSGIVAELTEDSCEFAVDENNRKRYYLPWRDKPGRYSLNNYRVDLRGHTPDPYEEEDDYEALPLTEVQALDQRRQLVRRWRQQESELADFGPKPSKGNVAESPFDGVLRQLYPASLVQEMASRPAYGSGALFSLLARDTMRYSALPNVVYMNPVNYETFRRNFEDIA